MKKTLPSLTNYLRGNTELLVLSVLKDQPNHGYGIAFEIERRSRAVIQFKLNTLYPVLHDLERNGMVTSEWQISMGERPKRVYHITDAGREELVKQVDGFEEMSLAVGRVLGLEGNGSSA